MNWYTRVRARTDTKANAAYIIHRGAGILQVALALAIYNDGDFFERELGSWVN
jgi:hypothetical protein